MKSILAQKATLSFHTSNLIKMSSKSNTNAKQIYSAKKPCCKVCVDAGKTEKEYSSHYVKDLNGNIMCPTLLSQECRYCHKKGHTTSHCSTLKKQKEFEENSRKPPVSPTKKPVSPQKKSNVFAYLEMNSDESDDEAEEFPELVAAEPKDLFEKEISSPKKFSYASMAAKTETEYKAKKVIEEKKPSPIVQQQQLKSEFTPRYVNGVDTKTGKKFSWADAESDSEGDDDEEEVYEDNSAW
jgi:hypothetical protein